MTTIQLDDAPLVLLLGLAPGESSQDVFACLQRRYDPASSILGAKYKIGSTYTYHGQKFAQVLTFAGSLIMQIMMDTKGKKIDRPIIYRFDSDGHFNLLNPTTGMESEVDKAELVKLADPPAGA